MPKYFFNPTQMQNGQITINGETAHHLIHVLRMTEGESLTMCDGANTDYTCTINSIIKKGKEPSITLDAKTASFCEAELPTCIILYQALPKGDKLDLIIQKCVELGAAEIVPVITSRSVAKLKDATRKSERYQRISESAAGQSMRGIVPKIHTAMPFVDAVKQLRENETTLVAYEEERTQTLQASLENIKTQKRINIWIGPEGGFAKDEIETLIARGATPVTLGKRILRTETAAIAMMAQVTMITEVPL